MDDQTISFNQDNFKKDNLEKHNFRLSRYKIVRDQPFQHINYNFIEGNA